MSRRAWDMTRDMNMLEQPDMRDQTLCAGSVPAPDADDRVPENLETAADGTGEALAPFVQVGSAVMKTGSATLVTTVPASFGDCWSASGTSSALGLPEAAQGTAESFRATAREADLADRTPPPGDTIALPGDPLEERALALWKEGREDEAIALLEREIEQKKQVSPAPPRFGPVRDIAPNETAPALVASSATAGSGERASRGDASTPTISIGESPRPGGSPRSLAAPTEAAGVRNAMATLYAIRAPRPHFGRPAGLIGVCAGAVVLLAGAVVWTRSDAPQTDLAQRAPESSSVTSQKGHGNSATRVASDSNVPMPGEDLPNDAHAPDEPLVGEPIRKAPVEARAAPEALVRNAPSLREPRVPKRRPEPRVAEVSADPEPRIAAASNATRSHPAEPRGAVDRLVAEPPVATRKADRNPRVALATDSARSRPAEPQREPERAARADDPDLFVPAGGDWTTYRNARFGTTVAFPNRLFELLPAPENGDGRQFANAAEDARLKVHAWENVKGETPQALQRRLAQAKGYGRVTYRSVGRNWVVLSGLRDGNVFYEKHLFDAASGTVHGFTIEYPKSRKGIFDPLVDRIEDSLRVGEPPADPEPPVVAAERTSRSRLAENRAAAERYLARQRAAAERSAARERPLILFAGRGLPSQ